MDNYSDKVIINSSSYTQLSEWGIGKKSGVTILNNEKLEIEYRSDTYIYFVYGEETPNFSVPPKENRLSLIPGESYIIEYSAEISEGINATLYIIGYSNTEKIQTEAVSPGVIKTITIRKECSKYRLAIRLSKGGIFRLKELDIKLVENKEVKQSELLLKREAKDVSSNINIKNIKELKVAAIVDYFTKITLGEECQLITFTPENWYETLEREKPHILFVESAWQGNDKAWIYKIGKYNKQDQSELFNLIKYCNDNSIPTVFWNKEDPIHFEKFINTSKIFDYIFTTDRNMIKNYKEITMNENVYDLPFAAQPMLHNPIRSFDRVDGVCFAGSYYSNRHAERKEDMEELLVICQKYNLVIYDRNYEMNKNNPNSIMKFPDKFDENIIGALDYSEINKAYKGYKVMVNVNSVKYSPTMFSRRVFEGLACGTTIVSTYSQGVKEFFDNIVVCNEDVQEIERQIEKLFNDNIYWKKVSLMGIREVMSKHTYSNRVRYILSKMNVFIEKIIPKVSCIVFVNSIEEINEAVFEFNNQKYTNKELIIIMKTNFKDYISGLNNYNKENIKCFIGNYLKEKYNNIAEIINGEYICYMNLENKYGENYILDMILGTIYTEAKVIGKKAWYSIKKDKVESFNINEEYIYVDKIKSDRCIINKEICENLNIEAIFKLFLQKEYIEKKSEKSIFSIDNNNFLENGKFYTDEEEINKIFM